MFLEQVKEIYFFLFTLFQQSFLDKKFFIKLRFVYGYGTDIAD